MEHLKSGRRIPVRRTMQWSKQWMVVAWTKVVSVEMEVGK